MTGVQTCALPIYSLVGSSYKDLIGGGEIEILQNSSFLVFSRFWDNGQISNAGAVTWCSGVSECVGVVSASNSLVGSHTSDFESFGYQEFSDGTFVISIPHWDNNEIYDAGAVTWCSETSGCSGTISANNSLVGNHTLDKVGFHGVESLENGNFILRNPEWNNYAGAVTWCSAQEVCAGEVSASNSLVGSDREDDVGELPPLFLHNGNYVLFTPHWNGPSGQVGAATWCNGNEGCKGLITSENSLVGNTFGINDVDISWGIQLANGDYVLNNSAWGGGIGAVTPCSGSLGCHGEISASNSLIGKTTVVSVGRGGVFALPNGNYLVSSVIVNDTPYWDGAVTFCSGTDGCIGEISLVNSLVSKNRINIVLLPNGNYVVSSPRWSNASVTATGAVTWCSGETGCAGEVSPSNSMIGISTMNKAGSVIVLPNSNYVIHSPFWSYGQSANAGAVTLCSGEAACIGEVSASNSLVGTSIDDSIGSPDGILVLNNGNYLVRSQDWDNNGAVNAGAVTWCSGTDGCTGEVSAANSLVGSSYDDRIGYIDSPSFKNIIQLPSGNYLVVTNGWDNSEANAPDAGAVTWCSGTTGCKGAVSASNSLVGGSPSDMVGHPTVLPNGNYIVGSMYWDNSTEASAGHVTWCSGTGGCVGEVSADNSLVGNKQDDFLGLNAEFTFIDNNYIFKNPYWDNGDLINGGSVTLGDGLRGTRGPVTTNNSVLAHVVNGLLYDGRNVKILYDPIYRQMIVGLPLEQMIYVQRIRYQMELPLVVK